MHRLPKIAYYCRQDVAGWEPIPTAALIAKQSDYFCSFWDGQGLQLTASVQVDGWIHISLGLVPSVSELSLQELGQKRDQEAPTILAAFFGERPIVSWPPDPHFPTVRHFGFRF